MAIDPEKDVVYFGRLDYRGSQRIFGIKRGDRRQHMYIIGKTGTGKSALLFNMITQDIANGEGVCVVDPHGELVEEILKMIPEERKDDVIYFNPADADYHIGFNILELPDPKYKHLVASGLMGIFTKIWSGVWSARMEYILNNAILALLDNPGSTLLGIPRLLVDKEYRQKIVAKVTDPVVRAFWVNEYEQWKDQFRNEAIAPIQNKVGQFLSTYIIRNVVGQAKSTINIFDLMNSGKIFLVNVSKGKIGEDNSALLGAMIVTKIQLAAMERVRIPEEERVDFYLYVDEFQNFATDSFAGILSEARKYRLNLILAHQYIGQLVTDVSTRVRDAIFGNVGTMVVFRVGAADAEFLEKEFEPEITAQDLVNLPNYSVYLRLMVDGITSRPFSAITLPPFRLRDSGSIAEEIIKNSQKRYARPRSVVEKEINEWSGVVETAEGGLAVIEPGKFPAVCAVCGTTFGLPFEPASNKPVYCPTCLAKIKSGKIPPVSREQARSEIPLAKKHPILAALGIEFAATEDKKTPPPPKKPKLPPASKAQTFPTAANKKEPPATIKPTGLPVPPKAKPVVRKTETKMPLTSLTTTEVHKKQPHPTSAEGTNIEELRQSIVESLENLEKEHEI